ncbi:MAG: TVP38/TMEM64 family protein [Pseudomonadota bacterium]|uniref:TVP38/TMEM64 family protein n=1 Tax=Phenylobacterium sp. TaxID=1871053 RepID=UPI0025FD0763|nr:TVP38/TMEM64 family protein [Phenylobacterium sp.]MBT9470471.1 TVP38/TMEM64 family protein [Phenylobacterium sp.]
MTEAEPPVRKALRAFARWTPAVLLIAATVWLYASGLATDISLDNIQAHEIRLRAEVAATPLLALAVFTILYAVATAAFVPVGLVLMLVGGFLFGPLVGTLATIVGSTAGAVMAYLAARFAAGDLIRDRLASGRLRKLVEGFERAPFRYLLTLRLVPLSPFGLVNVAAGCARAPFQAYLAATALGAVPYSLIYSYLGDGLGEAFLTSRTPTASILLTPDIAWPLTALAVVSLLTARLSRRDRTGAGKLA